MDEAGQMMEPEALVPLTLANSSTSIILVGDDKQLGPVLQSPSGIFGAFSGVLMFSATSSHG
jgi:superfamily I DNA and/or RNA helicase